MKYLKIQARFNIYSFIFHNFIRENDVRCSDSQRLPYKILNQVPENDAGEMA